MILRKHRLIFGLSGKLPLDRASTVILGSDSRGTHDHISLSHNSGESYKYSVDFRRTAQRYIPQDRTLHGEYVDLHIHSPTRCHGVVLNYS
jgi:hypothetical protein